MNEREIDAYWQETMFHRMSRDDEACRLLTVLRGFYLYDPEDCQTLFEFWQRAKRPYGNKSVEESIMFNLGWDWRRVLRQSRAPAWVAAEAEEIHRMVGERLSAEISKT